MWLAIITEASVAWLNTQYKSPKAVWLTNLLLFTVFAIVSASRLGLASCNCLGPVDVPAYWFFAFDSAVIVILILITMLGREGWRTPMKWASVGFVQLFEDRYLFISVSVLSVALILWQIGNKQDMSNQNSKIQYPRIVDFGEVKLSEGVVNTHFVLGNLFHEDLVIIGAETSCSCLIVDKIHKIPPIKPGDSIKLRVAIVPTRTGEFRQAIDLHVNHIKNNRIRVVFRGVFVN